MMITKQLNFGVKTLTCILLSLITFFRTSLFSEFIKDTGKEIAIVADGHSDYKIVYPSDSVSASQAVYSQLQIGLNSQTECELPMVKDSEEQSEYEILIGKTNRSASNEAYDKLKENQFSFSLSGNSVVIAAYDDKCMELAIKTFINEYVSEGNLSVISGLLPVTYKCGNKYEKITIDNTANAEADDPYVIRHNGYYYYCWSENGVKVSQIKNLDQINKTDGSQVFNSQENGFQSVWAPELHYIDGSWYIYVSMCKGTGDNSQHRMYCLKGTTQDPTDPFELIGQVTDETDKWAIDGTVFEYHNELYTVWSGWQGDVDEAQNLYIAHMSNPWTIDSDRVQISMPDCWDALTKNPSVNEGPCAIVVGDAVHILYSGNGSWTDDYSIGYLTCSNGKLLQSSSWKKSKKALLTKSDQVYGPGHCSVTTADDGSYQIIYHANLISGTGWTGRTVRVQELKVTKRSIKLKNKNPLQSTLSVLKEKYVIRTVKS